MSRREDQPQAAPHKGRAGVAGRNRPARGGSGRRAVYYCGAAKAWGKRPNKDKGKVRL